MNNVNFWIHKDYKDFNNHILFDQLYCNLTDSNRMSKKVGEAKKGHHPSSTIEKKRKVTTTL